MREPNAGKEKKLKETLRKYNKCVNAWIEAIDELGEYPNRGNVHNYAYHDIKERFPDLYSNTIQECMNKAIEIMRNDNGSLPEYKASSMSFKAVDMKYDRDNIGIPVTGKEKVWLPLIVPTYFGKYRDLERGRCTIQKRNGKWYALVSVEYPVKEQFEPEGIIGIDLGIRQIAVLSTPNGKINKFYGSDILSEKRELSQRWETLQEEKSGSNNKYQALERVSKKESKFMDYINHKVSNEVVGIAKHYRYKIAVENLKGLRKGKASKTLKRMLHRWAYRDLMDKIEYKAEAEGVPVEYVDPRNTTKVCSNCGTKNEVGDKKQDVCSNCGLEINRDLNGARNIASIPLLPEGRSLLEVTR